MQAEIMEMNIWISTKKCPLLKADGIVFSILTVAERCLSEFEVTASVNVLNKRHPSYPKSNPRHAEYRFCLGGFTRVRMLIRNRRPIPVRVGYVARLVRFPPTLNAL